MMGCKQRRQPERLDWLWFCEYDLDSDLPNHSVLSKAIQEPLSAHLSDPQPL